MPYDKWSSAINPANVRALNGLASVAKEQGVPELAKEDAARRS
jgi:hypothetical protein